jgi:hypothetical protein
MDIAIGVVNVMPFCKCYGIGNMLQPSGLKTGRFYFHCVLVKLI